MGRNIQMPSGFSPSHLSAATHSAAWAGVLLLVCGSVAVGAGQTHFVLAGKPVAGSVPASAAPPATGKSKLTLVNFELDEQTGIGTGHDFIYKTGDTVITGDNARYDKNKEILDADSHLVMDDPQRHVTGDKSHVDRGKALLVATGNVVLTMKPEATAPGADKGENVAGAKKQGGVITCDQVDSYYKRKFNILRGHLTFKQHILRPGKAPLDRTVTAEHAEYDGKKEILVLFAPVKGEDSDGSKFNSDKNPVTIGTKSGAERIEGVQGVLVFTTPEETDTDDSTPLPSAPPIVKGDVKAPDAKPDTTTKNP